MFCSHCGNQISEQADFCPRCGAAVRRDEPPALQLRQTSPGTNEPPSKKRIRKISILKWVFVSIIIIAVAAATYVAVRQGPAVLEALAAANAENKRAAAASLTALDERSWNDFLKAYEAHNRLVKMTEHFESGRMSKDDYYNFLQDIDVWFGDAFASLDYEKNENESIYLSSFRTMILSDQFAAKNYISYLDTGHAGDLARAREHVVRAGQAASVFSEGRAHLLRAIGLGDEQINAILEKSAKQLEEIDHKFQN